MDEPGNSRTPATASHVHTSRVIAAPRALVFAAWSQPEHLARWCHLDLLPTERMEADVRPGGHWDIDVRHPDGTAVRIRRIFREVLAPERIVFYEKCTYGDKVILDGVVTVRFADDNGKTRIDVDCDLATPFDIPNQQGWNDGWGQLFNRLALHVGAG